MTYNTKVRTTARLNPPRIKYRKPTRNDKAFTCKRPQCFRRMLWIIQHKATATASQKDESWDDTFLVQASEHAGGGDLPVHIHCTPIYKKRVSTYGMIVLYELSNAHARLTITLRQQQHNES